ncbi:hypothetical protein ABZV52_01035 [Streptomyces sp. NPDC004735]|uniref:hypothetical protein n=1 Tax=Streptomyces sp. NPDC004735 TaxID=3156654 RepID=UPI0033BAAE05
MAPLRWQRMRPIALQAAARDKEWEESDYVFTTRTGRPIEPRKISRLFERIGQNTG